MQFAAQGLVTGQSVGWLNVVALALFARVIFSMQHPQHIALGAWWFANNLLVGSWWWLWISMTTYGGLHPVLAALAVLALTSSVALIYAAAFYMYGWATLAVSAPPTSPRPTGQLLAFVGAWLLAELGRGTFFTGLPWGASGYAHVDGWLGKLAPWVGVYGLSALAAAGAGLAALVYQNQLFFKRPFFVLGGLIACLLVLPHVQFTQSTGTLGVTLLQGNIAQDEKFQPHRGVALALDWYRHQLLAATTPLVLAPETAIPILPHQLEPNYLNGLQAHFAQPGMPNTSARLGLVGIPWRQGQGYVNSVLGLGQLAPNGQAYRFDKHHLVPFGEYVPPLFSWFTERLSIPLPNFSSGSATQAPLAFAGQRIAPNICYEDLFGEEMAPLYRDAATAPTIMANFSNIAWFGNSIAIDQHRNISRMRALEFERPMLRATNTGATAIIDHHGKVISQLPRYSRGELVGEVEGRQGITPYAWLTARMGLWWYWLIGVGIVIAVRWLPLCHRPCKRVQGGSL